MQEYCPSEEDIRLTGYALKYASEEQKEDRELVLAAVSVKGSVLEYASEELRNDKQVVLAAVSNFGFALLFASEQLQIDKEVVIAAIKNNNKVFDSVSGYLQHDKEVLLAYHGYAIPLPNTVALEKLIKYENNYEEAPEELKQDGLLLSYASIELQNDKEILATVVDNIGAIPLGLSDHKEFVIAQVQYDGHLLEAASERLRDDYDVVMAAMSNLAYMNKSNCALHYASEEMRDNKEIVLEFIKSDIYDLSEYKTGLSRISKRLLGDKDVATALYKKAAEALSKSNSEYSRNPEICKIPYGISFFEVVSHELKDNKEFMLDLIKNYGFDGIGKISKCLRKDMDFIERAMECGYYIEILSQADPSLLRNERWVKNIIKKYGEFVLDNIYEDVAMFPSFVNDTSFIIELLNEMHEINWSNSDDFVAELLRCYATKQSSNKQFILKCSKITGFSEDKIIKLIPVQVLITDYIKQAFEIVTDEDKMDDNHQSDIPNNSFNENHPSRTFVKYAEDAQKWISIGERKITIFFSILLFGILYLIYN